MMNGNTIDRLANTGSGSSQSVRVAVRIRPQNLHERAQNSNVCVTVTPGQPQQVIIGRDNKAFTYDYVFDQPTPQHTIFETCIRQLVDCTFEGYNATVLAYGQTGSGKTYTMGTGFDTNQLDAYHPSAGIIPRAANHIFDCIEEVIERAEEEGGIEQGMAQRTGKVVPNFEVTVQFIELYNEEIIDLLADERQRANSAAIKIHEDPTRHEIYLSGIASQQVNSPEDILATLRNGAVNRATAATNMNQQSSRSHAIFTIMMKQIRSSEDDPTQLEELTSKFHFVDLAGSEGLRRTGATGDRAREGIHINKGLLDLGNVISALHEHSQHIPYRNGKLTQLLKDSLGGNSRTLMIACVSPSEIDSSETVKTLNYASRAMSIKNLQSRHRRLVKKLANSNGSADTDSTGSTIPPPDDEFPYSRALWNAWHCEVSQHLPADTPQMDSDFLAPPIAEEDIQLQLDGPNDLDAIARIREFFTQHIARSKGFETSMEENAKLYEEKLRKRLCLADLDRARVADLEEEVRKLKCELGARKRENRQLKRSNTAMESRLRSYETELANKNLQVERIKRYIDQEREPDKEARRTLHNVAKLFESPIPTTTNVARLRKKFDENNDGEEQQEDGPSQSKTPKLAPALTKSTVQFRDLTNADQRSVYRVPGQAGYMNPKYHQQRLHRRSRSAGAAPRVLNHQPPHKIPLGTVFQPKLPRSTKNTTQVEADDLKKHDEYLVTRQQVDQHGNVQTKLFKGDVTPTAGGGSAVVYRDVEQLCQKSPTASD